MLVSTSASCASTAVVICCSIAPSRLPASTTLSARLSDASCARMAVVKGVAFTVRVAPAGGVVPSALTKALRLPVGSVMTTKNGATSPAFSVQV